MISVNMRSKIYSSLQLLDTYKNSACMRYKKPGIGTHDSFLPNHTAATRTPDAGYSGMIND
jgi:hypothetical protein